MQVITVSFKLRMICNNECDIQISIRAAVYAWSAMSFNFYSLTVFNACGNRYPYVFSVDCQSLLMSPVRILQIQMKLGIVVLPPKNCLSPASPRPCSAKHG